MAFLCALAAFGCHLLPPEGPSAAVLPTIHTIRIDFPGAVGSQNLHISSLMLADTAEWYTETKRLTDFFNGVTESILDAVHTVIQQPPDEVTGDVFVWGPFPADGQAIEWRLTVTSNDDEDMNWRLDGRSLDGAIHPAGSERRNSGFRRVITGHATRGGLPNHGAGHFVVNRNNWARVAPDDVSDRGVVKFDYDLNPTDSIPEMEIRVRLTEDEIAEAVANKVKADYEYDEESDGSGELEFSTKRDVTGGSAQERVGILARWVSSGDGRADVLLKGGDLDQEVTVLECWDDSFLRVYYHDTAGIHPTEGDENDCVVD